jgi:uncharacterized coiled-coil protein SlyX
MATPESAAIAMLEHEIKQRDRRIAELEADLTKADAVISELREQVEDNKALVERWIGSLRRLLNDMLPLRALAEELEPENRP